MKTLIETLSRATLVSLLLSLSATSPTTAADLNVPADHPTIQDAVDAAQTDDTIRIAPGVYTDQVRIISKALTLIGQPGTILRATEAMSQFPAGTQQFPIIGVRSSQVTLRGLAFEGERLAESFVGPGELKGIFLRESSANVENCAFYGFRESAPGPATATAVVATGFADGEVNVRVAGCTFADNYRAIVVVGLPDRQSMNVTIENNTIIGLGPLDTQSNNYSGIAIREGVGGRIAGNTISGYSYVGTAAEFPIGFGILALNEANGQVAAGILQPLEIEGNTLRDNQVHIALIKGDGSVVKNNRFQGTAPGIIPLGLSVSGTNVTIANNQFEAMPEGIRLLGNDPMFGTLLGAALDAQVTSNRFCNVTTPVNLQPLATATETGTSLGPCSSPPLAIAPAVLVSWPAEEAGWTVESATSVDGPWAASDATPFTQYGRHSVAVPSEGGRRFFRLR